jgi:Tfp pilus assembly protein PilF
MPLSALRHLHRPALLLAASLMLSACGALRGPTGVTEVMERPAERQLINGLRQYDDAQYGEAEKSLKEALKLQLPSGRDQASAHKTLAFIYCTSNRMADCEAAFRAARVADPAFSLSKAEAGHPVWGPVYERSRR